MSAEVWSDERVEAALASLAEELVVPTAALETGRPATVGRFPPGRRILLAAAAALLVVIAVVAAVPPARRTVAGWLGIGTVTLERVASPATAPTGLEPFDDGVPPLDVAVAVAASGLDERRLDTAGLGVPERAGRPPEGGILLAWDGDDTTLWIRAPDEVADAETAVIKRLDAEDRAERIAGVGDAALLIDGEHVLTTPARRVAADRVLWWVVDDVEHRLESDRPVAELIAIARALTN